jgi:hypothetical protein
MAVWALGRLLDGNALASLATKHEAGESDDAVRTEWHLARGAA